MATGFDAYLEKIDARIARAPKGAAYPASIAATFGLAIEKAAAEHKAAEALLGFLAFLAPERIPLDLVDDDIVKEDDRAEALMALSAVSLIEHDVLEDGGPAVTLHRLVQAAMRARLADGGGVTATLERTTSRLSGAFPQDAYQEPKYWPRCAVLLPHVMVLRERLSEELSSWQAGGELLHRAGGYLLGRAAFGEAERLLRESISLGEKCLGGDHPKVAERLNDLGLLLWEAKRNAEAESVLRQAIKTGGRTHPGIGSFLNNLGLVLKDTGRFAEAEPLFRESVTIGEQVFGREHEEVAIRLNNLASALWMEAARNSEAEQLMREAIAIDERILGRGHATVAVFLVALGNLLVSEHRYEEAEPLLREALTRGQNALGAEHPRVGNRLFFLAQLLHATGRNGDAEPLLRDAIAIWQKTVGPEFTDIGRAHETLAQIMLKTNRLEEALAEAQTALRIYEKTLRAEHPRAKDAARTSAEAFAALGRGKEAAALRALWPRGTCPN